MLMKVMIMMMLHQDASLLAKNAMVVIVWEERERSSTVQGVCCVL